MVKFISKLFGKRPDDDRSQGPKSTGSGEPSKKPSNNQQSESGKSSKSPKTQGKTEKKDRSAQENRQSDRAPKGEGSGSSSESGDAPKKRRRRRRSGGEGRSGDGRKNRENRGENTAGDSSAGGSHGGDANGGGSGENKSGEGRRSNEGRREGRSGEGRSRKSGRSPDGARKSRDDRPPRKPRKSDAEVAAEAAAAHAEWDPASYDVPVEEGKTRFVDFDIPSEVLHAISDLGFQYATPIQAEILPSIIEGRDAVGQAQTGTGKTAAFLTSLFTHLMRNKPSKERKIRTPRALILAPTRELAQQIEKEARQIGKYTGLRTMAVFGGMDYVKQKRILEDGVIDVIAATPGRLIDFMRSKDVILRDVEVLVIDEADRMLDMGFIPDVRRITRATPPVEKRRTMFFSATYTEVVHRLADSWTNDPVKVEIEPESIAADTVDQTVFIVTNDEKFAIVINLLQKEQPERVLIFVNRRDQVSSLYRKLYSYEIAVAEMSGSVPQNKRQRVLEDFRSAKINVMVATDVAGRGIHIDGINYVINYNLPDDAEDYVHRIGRTGRAGAEGKAFSFATEDDGLLIPPIEEYINRELPCKYPKADWLILPKPTRKPPPSKKRDGGGRGGSGGGRGGSGGGRGRSGGGGRGRSGGGGGGRGRSGGGGGRRRSSGGGGGSKSGGSGGGGKK